MNRTTVPHADEPPRPLIVRAAHRWYSWAAVAVTVAGSYLAANGQLRLGEGARLQAAPPDSTSSTWKPSGAPAAESEKITLTPGPVADDLFKAAPPKEPPPPILPAGGPPTRPVEAMPVKLAPAVTTQKLEPTADAKPTVGSKLSVPFVPVGDVKPVSKTRAGTVLDVFADEKVVVPPVKKEEPSPSPSFTAAPSPPAVTTETVPFKPVPVPAGPTMPAPATAAAPKELPLPASIPPVPAAPVAKSQFATSGGATLPPIPPPPGPVVPASQQVDEGRPPNMQVAQEPEKIQVLPRPLDQKKEAPPKKRKLVGKLSQDDEIKLNAAQNAARLRDFNRAAALMADVISRNPEEYDLRAEYAGILLAAGDPKGAIRELERVVKAAPNVPGYRLLLGDAYMADRNFKAAAAVFESVLGMIKDDPKLAERLPEVVIRAARAYALGGDLFKAAFLVDKNLADIKPDDPKAPLAMGAMLLDLDRPYDALPYLIEKRKQLLASPEATEEYELKVLEVLASMVRAFARLGDRQQAMDAIQEMATRAPRQTAIRNSLADILFELGEHDLAGHVFNQVLAVDPANAAALIGIARVYLETFRPAEARRVLDSFAPNAPNHRQYLLTYSSYHQTVGEYTEAKQIYKDMLRRNENDHEVRYALGRLYEYTNEWEKAKAEFAKIPPNDKMARRARLWFGMALLHQHKFAEAAQVAEQFVADDPNNAEGIALYVRAVAKMGQFDKAIQAGRGYLASNPRDDRSAATVRLAVARALLEANRNLDAAREYEIALSKPAGRVPEAYYGLARAAEKLGNPDRAHQIIGTICGPAGTDIRNRVAIADFYSLDFEDHKVLEIIGPLAAAEPNNLALLIRLADAQQRAARWPGDPAEAFITCQNILRQSPTNVRGHLAMARSFATAQAYRKSAVQYDQLIAMDPEFTIPPRERARVLFSDKQYSAARTQYNVMLSPAPDEVILAQMTYYAQRDARIRTVFGPYLGGAMSGPALRAELARLAGSSPEDDVRITAHRLLCDFDATVAWQEAFRLERDAKELKDYRNYAAVPQYNASTQFEPTNAETLFDLGQVYGALKMTRAALTWYGNTQALDPTHRDSAVASERAAAEISPKFDLRGEFFHQRGRDGLASIDRQRYIAAASLPIGDENEYVQVGYMQMGYRPLDDPQLWGYAPFLRVQKKWDDNRLMTYGQVNLEEFRDRFDTRPTFDAGFWYDHSDLLRVRGGAFLENVAENGESMRQDIYRYGLYGGADLKPTRTWSFGGLFTYAHYSDDNDTVQAYAYNELALSLPPKQIKLVQLFNAYSFSQQSIFPTPIPNPNNLRGVVHPYFAPDSFCSAEFRVEWWHWLSRDYFTHSNQCYYSLQYGIATDNDLVTYHDLRAIFNYDINSCFTVGTEARAYLGSGNVYKMYSVMGFLQVRFLSP